jgi:hypothetical protein
MSELVQNLALTPLFDDAPNVAPPALYVKDETTAATRKVSVDGGVLQVDDAPAGGVTDHGILTGLGDDDHGQYFNASRISGALITSTGTGISRALADRFAEQIVIDDVEPAPGATDDTSRLQAAIALARTRGGAELVATRQYDAAGLVIPGPLAIVGRGPKAKLKLTNGANTDLLKIQTAGALDYSWVSSPIAIRQVTLDGNRANNTSGHILSLVNGDYYAYVLFDQVWAINAAQDTINASSWQGVLYAYLSFLVNAARYNVYANTCFDWHFLRSDIFTAADEGVRLSGCGEFIFTATNVYANGGYNIYNYADSAFSPNCGSIVISNCSLDLSEKAGYYDAVNTKMARLIHGTHIGKNSRYSPGTYGEIETANSGSVGLTVSGCRFPKAADSNATPLIKFGTGWNSYVGWEGNTYGDGTAVDIGASHLSNKTGLLLVSGDAGTHRALRSGSVTEFMDRAGGSLFAQSFISSNYLEYLVNLRIARATPSLMLQDSGAPPDRGKWIQRISSGNLEIYGLSDDEGTSAKYLEVKRNGTTFDGFAVGGAYGSAKFTVDPSSILADVSLWVRGTNAIYYLQETDAPTDQKNWLLAASDSQFRLQTMTDALGGWRSALEVDRTGATITAVRIGGVNGSAALLVSPVANQVNYVAIIGSVTGNPVRIGPAGECSDTNVDLEVVGRGTGKVKLGSGSNTVQMGVKASYASLPTVSDDKDIPSKKYVDDGLAALTTVQGIVIPLTAGEAFAAGEVGYVKSDGKIWKADANGVGTYPVKFMATAAISADASGNFLRLGKITNEAWSWTAGGTLYLSTTAGTLTQTQPSATDDVIQVVGEALSATQIFFDPSPDYLTHT